MSDGMLKVSDVAERLGCSTRTVYRLIATGNLPKPLRIGKLIRWEREGFEAWIAAGCPPPK